jgi:hypothetical protein
MSHHTIEWIDMERKPKVAPNPAYPDGIDIDLSRGAEKTCTVELPYPAKRIGYYVVACTQCDLRTGITTAGRPDDPRSVKLECKR